MTAEQPFEVPVPGGILVGHRGGTGDSALVLHGGPAIPDYTEGLVAELEGLFATARYTQRGVPPSVAAGPYTIEAHAADAIGVLDHLGVDRAWIVGHSWGAHLALHVALTYPERLQGIVAVCALGAFGDALTEMSATLGARLTPVEVEHVAAAEERRRRGEATEEDLVERWGLLWPGYFVDPRAVTASPSRVGPDASRETNASISEHLERGTLERGLPGLDLPVLFVHGELDPLPLWSAERTAALIPGAQVEVVAACGHFPWAERPGETCRHVAAFLDRLGE